MFRNRPVFFVICPFIAQAIVKAYQLQQGTINFANKRISIKFRLKVLTWSLKRRTVPNFLLLRPRFLNNIFSYSELFLQIYVVLDLPVLKIKIRNIYRKSFWQNQQKGTSSWNKFASSLNLIFWVSKITT